MKYSSGKALLADKNKRILLMGLSGVGKTTACRMLPDDQWFHYSIDYRLWTHHLDTQLNDYLKQIAMKQPLLRELLMKDSVIVSHKVHFDNLYSTSVYMGMLGNAKTGGSSVASFKHRMREYAVGEIAATLDVPMFVERAQRLYDYPHFIADASGSLCEIIELDDPDDPIMQMIDATCLPIYVEATSEHIQELLRRAASDPKPIYYRPDFVEAELPGLLQHFTTDSISKVSAKQVGAHLYPRVLAHRIPRYEEITRRIGYKISMTDVLRCREPEDFLQLIAKTIDQSKPEPQNLSEIQYKRSAAH